MLNYFNAPLVGSDPIVPPIADENTPDEEFVHNYELSYCYHENMLFNTGSDTSEFEGEYSDWSIQFEASIYDYSYCRHAYMQNFMIESNYPDLAFKWCPRITNENRCEQRCAAIDETVEKKDR